VASFCSQPVVHGHARAWTVAPLVVAGALVLGEGCGSSTPVGPGGAVPGGTIAGRYLLEITPAASCAAAPPAVSLPMLASAAGVSPHPGVQILLDGGDPALLELELKYTDFVLEGGFGTTGDGVASNQGTRVWVNAIGTGPVTQTSGGRGEVVSGSLRGYLEVEGMNACTAANHSFTLRPL